MIIKNYLYEIKEAKVYKANAGFVGFIAPRGEATIELDYFTPGLKTGLLISLGGLILFLGLMFILEWRFKLFTKNKKIEIKNPIESSDELSE